MDDIAVLIPCYNEERTIRKVIEDFKRVLPTATIYVYNNNSKDHTAEIAADAGAIVRNEYMQGKGNVIRRMFREIDAKCYIMVDGDDTYSAESAPVMVSKIIEGQCDMVVGDRLSSTYFEENKRPFHNFGNIIVRLGINTLFKSDIRDIMTGYRAFSYQFVKTFPVLSRGFEIETEMSIHSIEKNLSVDNVIIDYRDRPEGSVSKLNTYSDGLKVIRTVLRLFSTYKPKKFYTVVSAVLFSIALIFFVPILTEYIQTGLVPKIPTLIMCGFVVIAAIQAFFAGMILETIEQKNKQDFEIELQHVSQRLKEMECK